MWLNIAFSVLIFFGIFMTVVPMAPGITYMFIMAGIFGLLTSFQAISLQQIGILGGIFILSILIDYLSGIIGAKYGGASGKAILYGFLGSVVGFITFPPFGGLLGLFAGILAYSFFVDKDEVKALRAATGYILGAMTGVLINFFLAILFFILFLIFVF